MAKYYLDDEFKQIPIDSGIIANISNYKAEINVTPENGGIILYPRHRLTFRRTIYAARAPGEVAVPIVATLPFMEFAGGGSSDCDDLIFVDDGDVDTLIADIWGDTVSANNDDDLVFVTERDVDTLIADIWNDSAPTPSTVPAEPTPTIPADTVPASTPSGTDFIFITEADVDTLLGSIWGGS